MRKNRLRVFTIIVGSILALAIAFSQFLTPECIASAEKAKTEQDGGKADTEESTISLPTYSLPAPVQVQANLDVYCLFEILLEEDIDENDVAEDLFFSDRFFATMFRVIISPNAP